jgi:hypothetical protein
MDGSATVLRLASAFAVDTSAIRRIAPRNVFVMFMSFSSLCVARAPSPAMQKTCCQVEQGISPAIGAYE